MPQQRQFQQERQFQSDEQADYPGNQLKRVQREFDSANPPVVGSDPTESGGVPASLTTSLAGANNDLVFTANRGGANGNSITVTYTDPGGVSATLGVTVSGNDINVNLGRAASAINSTAAQVAAAILGNSVAAGLVNIANAAGNDGTGLVTALTKTNLSGGVDDVLSRSSKRFRQTAGFRSSEQDPVYQEIAKRYQDS